MHQAIEFYEQNLRLSRETGDQRGEMAALNSLGRAFAALEEREKAVKCYEQALGIARQIGDVRGERLTLKNLDEVRKSASEPADVAEKKNRQTSRSQKSGKRSKSTKTKSSRDKTSQSRTPKQRKPTRSSGK